MMDAPKSVTAIFYVVLPVRVISATTLFHGKSADALCHPHHRGTLRLREFEFKEDLVLNRPIPVLLKGGYNAGYTSNGNFSIIRGA